MDNCIYFAFLFQIQFEPEDFQFTEELQNLFTLPYTRMFGNISNTSNWLFETVKLPPISSGTRIQLQAQFDMNRGAVGLDNIQLHTQQK